MASEASFGADIAPEVTPRRDVAVAELARRQHGTVARAQMLALGMGAGAIKHRLACGRLHEVHRGVYAVGHSVLSMRGRWMAAVLAAGPGAVLSHRSAAALWGIRNGTAIEVTTPHRVRRPGIRARGATLPPDEITTRAGIPVTTVARTLLDLAAVLARHDVESAFHEAEYQHRTDLISLDAPSRTTPAAEGPPRSTASSTTRVSRPAAPRATWNATSSPSSMPTVCPARTATSSSRATNATASGPSTG